jgi:hypothetical protein
LVEVQAATGPAGESLGSLVRTRVRSSLRDLLETSVLGVETLKHPLPRVHDFPDGSERIYCFHVRKTGGTSLHRSFLSIGGEDPAVVERRLSSSFLHRTASGGYVFAVTQRRVLEQGRYFYGWSHMAAHKLKLPPQTFTVSILRDPVSRVASYYNYLLAGDPPGTAFPVPETERERARNGFHSLLDTMPRSELLRQLFMFSASFNVNEAVDRASRCSMLFFNEEYSQGLRQLSQRLNLRLEMRHDRAGTAKVELSQDEHDRVRALLEREYQMIEQLRDDRLSGTDASSADG